MIGEIGLHVVCTRVRCVRWGKKGQDSKKEREKWKGGWWGKEKKRGGRRKGVK